MRSRRALLIAFPILAVLVALVFVFNRGDTPTSEAAPSGPGVMRFIDTKRDTAFRVQIDPAQPDAGRFAFTISGVGQYIGGSAESMKIVGQGSAQINYKGPATFVALEGEGLEASATAPPRTVSVIVNAHINPSHHTATATLSDEDHNTYQMISERPPGNTKQVARDFFEALVGRDWNRVYELTSKSVLQGYSAEDFTALIEQQEGELGTIVEVVLTSDPVVESNPAGMTFFSVEQRATIEKDGLTTRDFISYFILEDGVWKFWFSAPSPSTGSHLNDNS